MYQNCHEIDTQLINSNANFDTQNPQISTKKRSLLEVDIEDLNLSSYDYTLPLERIAQNPAVPRDSARLIVVDSPTTGNIVAPQDRIFRDLPHLLQVGDLLVMNNTRVIPARLYGCKSTGAPVEVLLLEEKEQNCWLALVKPGRRLKPGARIVFTPKSDEEMGGLGDGGTGRWGDEEMGGLGDGGMRRWGDEEERENKEDKEENFNSKLKTQHSEFNTPSIQNPKSKIQNLTATVVATDEATGGRLLKFDVPEDVPFVQLLEEFGHVPLPPYINASQAESEQYQTVYADRQGAIAAPTAGLHFTDELISRLQERGIEQAFVTLHVGVGTFRPVEVEDVTTHQMHQEWVDVPAATVEKIRETKSKGGRIIAVGTTVVRALESAAISGEVQPYCGKTDLFIYPGYEWRVVEGLITNFHLPKSSLLMLVSALVGRQRLLKLYQEAIAREYRFYSFGDAMLILPEAMEF